MTTHFDWKDNYNVWSGLLGGTFLFLSYFGCDQSQVQRYLTGKSVTASRLSLLFNAVAKIPMQFFILFIGAMVFVFYLFVQPPLLFENAQLTRIQSSGEYAQVSRQFETGVTERRAAALALAAAHRAGDTASESREMEAYRAAQSNVNAAHTRAEKLVELTGGEKGFKDTNYIFLTFVTHYLPVGLVGLVIAVIFAATMSASSGEINSLATVTLVDIYRRHIRKHASDHHYVMASRVATLFWGVYAVAFAGWGRKLGSLIVAVNVVGSLFYGSLLGCLVLAFGFRKVRGTATFIGMLSQRSNGDFLGQLSLAAFRGFWYNVIGCGVVVLTALADYVFGTAAARRGQ